MKIALRAGIVLVGWILAAATSAHAGSEVLVASFRDQYQKLNDFEYRFDATRGTAHTQVTLEFPGRWVERPGNCYPNQPWPGRPGRPLPPGAPPPVRCPGEREYIRDLRTLAVNVPGLVYVATDSTHGQIQFNGTVCATTEFRARRFRPDIWVIIPTNYCSMSLEHAPGRVLNLFFRSI